MPTVPIHTCTDNPSYFSDKCNRCRFACLKDDGDRSRSSLSIPGIIAVAAGAAASVAGYPVPAAGLTIAGAIAVVARIINK